MLSHFRESLKEKATSITPKELKDIFLEKLEPFSPELHNYCKGLFKHQEAQQVFTKLRDKQDREEVIAKMLAPSRQAHLQAERRLHDFINNEQPPLNFDSDEFKFWKARRDKLQAELEEARRRADVEQNIDGRLDTVKSLKDLDDHSETYRLFATSMHYGYFVIIFLGWLLYSIYYTGLYLIDRIPAQRKDLKKSQQKLETEIGEMGKKIDEMQNDLVAVLAVMKQQQGEIVTMMNEKKKKEEEKDFSAEVEEKPKVVHDVPAKTTTMTSIGIQTDDNVDSNDNDNTKIALVDEREKNKKEEKWYVAISSRLNDFMKQNDIIINNQNPVVLSSYVLFLIVMLVLLKRMISSAVVAVK